MSVASWCSMCFCVVLCVGFCTGYFVMVALNMTHVHYLQHSFFEHRFNLYYDLVRTIKYLKFFFASIGIVTSTKVKCRTFYCTAMSYAFTTLNVGKLCKKENRIMTLLWHMSVKQVVKYKHV